MPLFQAWIQGHNKGVSLVYLLKDCLGNISGPRLLLTWNLAWSTCMIAIKNKQNRWQLAEKKGRKGCRSYQSLFLQFCMHWKLCTPSVSPWRIARN